jgi:hypothetical protein
LSDGSSGVSLTRMGVQTVVAGPDETSVRDALAALVAAGAQVVAQPRALGPQWIAVCEGVPEAGAYRW